ncbi:CRISPR-associated endonuclease Cas2 [Brevibacillus brevis]|uniref:CRISPR-associated endonuclease Cas2 n=1 Tax=Brevibacillus brevis TaxID=1393 RepID=UPI000B37FB0B|nr:CRISPR-associated endonuclease Cas2 [Brevibacillus brevis]OUQ84993.1 CRISPR-associated endonuclease Cas2 [Brevibacillus brevis]OUQ88189.1 CRISPR-associated endonuclease Cas2 [Brevibacillus brevis]
MMVLITYDVSTKTASGQKRLRQVARLCENYGQRVQNSVFECLIDPQQFTELQFELKRTIDPATDSLRFYHLGAKWKGKVEHIGANQNYDPEGFIMI